MCRRPVYKERWKQPPPLIALFTPSATTSPAALPDAGLKAASAWANIAGFGEDSHSQRLMVKGVAEVVACPMPSANSPRPLCLPQRYVKAPFNLPAQLVHQLLPHRWQPPAWRATGQIQRPERTRDRGRTMGCGPTGTASPPWSGSIALGAETSRTHLNAVPGHDQAGFRGPYRFKRGLPRLASQRATARLSEPHPTQPAVDRGAVPTPCPIARTQRPRGTNCWPKNLSSRSPPVCSGLEIACLPCARPVPLGA